MVKANSVASGINSVILVTAADRVRNLTVIQRFDGRCVVIFDIPIHNGISKLNSRRIVIWYRARKTNTCTVNELKYYIKVRMTTIWISAEFPELELSCKLNCFLPRRYDAQDYQWNRPVSPYTGPNFQEQFLIMTMGIYRLSLIPAKNSVRCLHARCLNN